MRLSIGKRTAAAVVAALLVVSLAPANAIAAPGYRGYSDVDSDDWYVTSGIFDYTLDHGLMSGYSGTTLFGPYDTVTRGQVAVVLWRLAGSPTASSADFGDVDYGIYYGAAIRWARSTGVVNGYAGTNYFGPDDNVSREQLVTMLYNYASNVADADVAASDSEVSRISGWDSVSDWAKEPFAWAFEKGIVSGVSASSGPELQPQGNAWRASMASMSSALRRDVLKLDGNNNDGNKNGGNNNGGNDNGGNNNGGGQVTKVNYTALDDAIAKASGLKQANYTDASWAALSGALKSAQDVRTKQGATQAEVDSAAKALQGAIDGLVSKTSFTRLDAAIKQAEGLASGDYTADSWKAVSDALAAAKGVRGNDKASQADADAAAKKLETAMGALVHKDTTKVNYSALDTAISRAEALDSGDYTASSWSDVSRALGSAKQIRAKQGATQAEVDSAAKALTDALDRLVEGANLSALNAAISRAKALKQSDYTLSSWDAVAKALSDAEKVAAKADPTQDEVNAVAQRLNSAMGSLVKQSDADAAVAKAKQELEAAKKELSDAKAAQSDAQGKLDDANKAVSDAQEPVTDAQKAVDAAQAKVDAAQKKVDDATAAQKAAQDEFDKGAQGSPEYQEALQDAQNAKERVDYYQEYVDRYEGELKDNQSKLADAQKAYDDAVTKANGDAAKVKRGSYAFFESIGATDAVSILNNEKGYTDTAGKPFNQYNDPSNTLDATSLENMRRALDMMDRCNELRKQNGLSELKVTSALMAVAQTDANWSSYNGDHAGNNGNDYSRSENLAWSYSDPFKGWYDEEKKEYESGNTNYYDIGHYLNIVNKNYTVTGYGYSRYGNTDAQQFDFDAKSFGSGTSYTVGEYRQLFEQYYRQVTGGASSQDVIKAQDAVFSSELDVQTYKDIVKNQQDAYDSALKRAEALAPKGNEEAKKKLDAANDALDAAKSELASAQSTKASADKTLSDANSKLSSAKSAQQSAQSAKDAADKRVTDADKRVASAQKAYDDAVAKAR